MPIILVTARAAVQDIVAGLDAGADEYLTKPVEHAALVARVRSILRTKALHDTVQEQAGRAQLADWNRTLERRVAEQVAEIERVGRLRRFLPPQVAELIVASAATSACWRATAARSRSCSATCAASPPSPSAPSPRR